MDDYRARTLPLLAAWGYRAEDIGEVRPVFDVYRVETAAGPKNLKWTRLSDETLLFIISALRYLKEHGFDAFSMPVPTLAGEPFLILDRQHYLLSDWIEGRQVDLAFPQELEAACRTLARFHQASRGFTAPLGASACRQRWGRLTKTFARRCEEMKHYNERARNHAEPSKFELEIAAETEYYLSLATFAHRLLDVSAYQKLAAQAASIGYVCHGDVAARNFIIGPDGRIALIDFDAVNQDLPLADLWKLYRRTMKTFNWNHEIGLAILEAYESEQPLSLQELEVLMALLSFPEKFWRLANRYYSGLYRVDGDRFYNKLRRYTAQRKAQAQFLRKFAEICRRRGLGTVWPPAPFADRPV